ncbi:MAG: hypothetical protein NUV85_01590 [Candidatus Berkelbacteria bacterium]|nr:hypothetical protein [Candidatus Berkelbacteria bacterium]
MSTKPFLNALVAAGYIGVIVTILFNTEKFGAQEFGVIAPITFLSLLVLSVALMGYLFFYQPARLMIEGKPQEAGRFLLSTIASFVGITATVIASWFLLSALF